MALALAALLRDEGLRVRVEVVVVVVRPFEDPTPPNRLEEAAVDAVAEDGRRTGLVGDFERGLLLGALEGDVLELSSDGVVPRVVRDVVLDAGFRDARLGL